MELYIRTHWGEPIGGWMCLWLEKVILAEYCQWNLILHPCWRNVLTQLTCFTVWSRVSCHTVAFVSVHLIDTCCAVRTRIACTLVYIYSRNKTESYNVYNSGAKTHFFEWTNSCHFAKAKDAKETWCSESPWLGNFPFSEIHNIDLSWQDHYIIEYCNESEAILPLYLADENTNTIRLRMVYSNEQDFHSAAEKAGISQRWPPNIGLIDVPNKDSKSSEFTN